MTKRHYCHTCVGDMKGGDLGLGAVPGREQEFRKGLELAVQYAKALDCRRYRIHHALVTTLTQRAEVRPCNYKRPEGMLYTDIYTSTRII